MISMETLSTNTFNNIYSIFLYLHAFTQGTILPVQNKIFLYIRAVELTLVETTPYNVCVPARVRSCVCMLSDRRCGAARGSSSHNRCLKYIVLDAFCLEHFVGVICKVIVVKHIITSWFVLYTVPRFGMNLY